MVGKAALVLVGRLTSVAHRVTLVKAPSDLHMSRLILTADQRNAVEGILRDTQHPGARVMLCGYAGTGKTVTTAALVGELRSCGLTVVVARQLTKLEHKLKKP